MKNITRWSPDTCGCVFDYAWEDVENRVHTLKTVVKKCSEHTSLDDAEAYNAVKDENTRKNITFGIIQKARSDITSDDYHWSFNKERQLQVEVTINTSAPVKAKLQADINKRFGEGKVKVS